MKIFGVLRLFAFLAVACGGSAPAATTTFTSKPTVTMSAPTIPRSELTGEAGGLQVELQSARASRRSENWSCDEEEWFVSHEGVDVVVTLTNVADAQRSLSSYQFLLVGGDPGIVNNPKSISMLNPSGLPIAGVNVLEETIAAGEVRRYRLDFAGPFYSAPEDHKPNLRKSRFQVLWVGQSELALDVDLARLLPTETWGVPSSLLGAKSTVYIDKIAGKGIAVDGAGNLFVIDSNASDGGRQVVKVDAETAVITTVAGTGTGGDRRINPREVAVDGGGNLFINDGRLIYLMNSEPSKFAGVLLLAGFYVTNPVGLAVDGAGNLFVIDSDLSDGSRQIRRMDAETKLKTIVSGEPGINPTEIAVDGAGNLFIIDYDSSDQSRQVLKVDAETGVITTVAGGTGTGGDGGPATEALLIPTEIAVDGAGNLFIIDIGSSIKIRKVDAETGVITTVAAFGAGTGCAVTRDQLGYSYGLAVDASGDLFIATDHGIVLAEPP